MRIRAKFPRKVSKFLTMTSFYVLVKTRPSVKLFVWSGSSRQFEDLES